MITNETRLIDLTVADLTAIIGKTVKSSLPPPIQVPEQNIPDVGGIELAQEITGWSKATIYTKCHFRSLPHSKKGGKLFFSRTELLTWLKEGKRTTRKEIDQQATDYVAFRK